MTEPEELAQYRQYREIRVQTSEHRSGPKLEIGAMRSDQIIKSDDVDDVDKVDNVYKTCTVRDVYLLLLSALRQQIAKELRADASTFRLRGRHRAEHGGVRVE